MNAKHVTARMRSALRSLEHNPTAHLGLHGNTLRNLQALQLAEPRQKICSECGTHILLGWYLTPQGKAVVRNLGLVEDAS